jgi:hypothetical protein
MTDWAAMLVPAGTLVAGSVLTMFGQVLIDRRALRREREARRDAYKVKRYELERETLLALQNAISEHCTIAIRVMSQRFSGRHIGFDILEKAIEVAPLHSRVRDDHVSAAVFEYLEKASQGILRKIHKEAVLSGYEEAQNAIGRSLRRDPIEQEA